MNIGIDIDDTLTHTFEHFVPLVAAYFHVPEEELWEKNISCDNIPDDWLKDPCQRPTTVAGLQERARS